MIPMAKIGSVKCDFRVPSGTRGYPRAFLSGSGLVGPRLDFRIRVRTLQKARKNFGLGLGSGSGPGPLHP